MSKSIYEVALEYARILNTLPTAAYKYQMLVMIERTLEQAQKQEKLLELYKEALETNFEGITLIKLVNKTLRTQIKELENEGGNDNE